MPRKRSTSAWVGIAGRPCVRASQPSQRKDGANVTDSVADVDKSHDLQSVSKAPHEERQVWACRSAALSFLPRLCEALEATEESQNYADLLFSCGFAAGPVRSTGVCSLLAPVQLTGDVERALPLCYYIGDDTEDPAEPCGRVPEVSVGPDDDDDVMLERSISRTDGDTEMGDTSEEWYYQRQEDEPVKCDIRADICLDPRDLDDQVHDFVHESGGTGNESLPIGFLVSLGGPLGNACGTSREQHGNVAEYTTGDIVDEYFRVADNDYIENGLDAVLGALDVELVWFKGAGFLDFNFLERMEWLGDSLVQWAMCKHGYDPKTYARAPPYIFEQLQIIIRWVISKMPEGSADDM